MDFTVFVSFIKIQRAVTIKHVLAVVFGTLSLFFCVNLVNVEAVGGRRFEKMLQDMREVSLRFFLLYFIECFLTQTTIFLKSYHIFVLLKPRKA